MDKDCLIVTVIFDAFEEETSTERRELKGSDIDVDSKLVPCVCAYGVREDSRNQAIEVKDEEEGSENVY